MSKPYPWYYAVNDRPVKIVATADGGADCLVFDFASGGFKPDRQYFAHVAPGSGKDVDQLTEGTFAQLVASRRAEAAARRRARTARWNPVEGAAGTYTAELDGRRYTLRHNPADATYTLMLDGSDVEEVAELPATWEIAR